MIDGPDLFYLMQKIQNIPKEFSLDPVLLNSPKSYKGKVHVDAVLSDLFCELGAGNVNFGLVDIYRIDYSDANKNYLLCVLLACHVYYDPWFFTHSKNNGSAGVIKSIKEFLDKTLPALAKHVQSSQFIYDIERREEFVRVCLNALNLRPKGESDSVAKDRLNTVDTIERLKVIEQSRQAQKRAQELREAIARREAEEAASKWGRE